MNKDAESRLEQAANLLGLWKAHLREYKENLGFEHATIFDAAYARLKLCIEELEAVLTGNPLP